MTVFIDRLEIVFPIERKARPAAASIRTLEITESGAEFEQLAPMSPELVQSYAAQFSLPVLEENQSLKQQLAVLAPQAGQVPGLLEQVTNLQAEVTRLTALVPPPLPPRSIYPRELLGRLTRAEIVAAILTEDPDSVVAVANLQTTVDPVLLDSTETLMLFGALVKAGILTSERMAEVLA